MSARCQLGILEERHAENKAAKANNLQIIFSFPIASSTRCKSVAMLPLLSALALPLHHTANNCKMSTLLDRAAHQGYNGRPRVRCHSSQRATTLGKIVFVCFATQNKLPPPSLYCLFFPQCCHLSFRAISSESSSSTTTSSSSSSGLSILFTKTGCSSSLHLLRVSVGRRRYHNLSCISLYFY